MMLIRCLKCQEIFGKEDLKVDYTEGGYLGEPHYSCPYCRHDEWEYVGQCSHCGKYYSYDEDPVLLFGSTGSEMCKDCIEDVLTTDIVLDFGDDEYETSPVEEINGLLAFAFSAGEINDILRREFKNLPAERQKEYIKDYLDGDYDNFADWFDKGGTSNGN